MSTMSNDDPEKWKTIVHLSSTSYNCLVKQYTFILTRIFMTVTIVGSYMNTFVFYLEKSFPEIISAVGFIKVKFQ